MKKTKSLVILCTAILAVCFLFTLSLDGQAEAVDTYGCVFNGISKNCKTVELVCTALPQDYKYEVALFNNKKKKLGTVECDYRNTTSKFSDDSDKKYIYALFKNKTAKNKIYYYNVRVMKYDTEQGKYVEEYTWSKKYGMFNTISSYKMKNSPSKRTVTITVPKVAGVNKYLVYLSNKKNSGYKKYKTVTPGKKVTLNKFNGKKFALNKKYYIKVRPSVKDTDSYGGLSYGGFIRFIRK